MSNSLSASMALTAAALFLGACSSSAKDTTQTPEPTSQNQRTSAAKIKCFGVNECAGQAACAVPDNYIEPGSVGHSCAGQNECKGKGWLSLTAEECDTQGGKPM